jgi:hypothetical protein
MNLEHHAENTKMPIPENALKMGTELAESGALIYGQKLTDLTREELIAVAALGWNAYSKQLEQTMDMLRTHGQ